MSSNHIAMLQYSKQYGTDIKTDMESRNKSKHIWSTNIWQGPTMEKSQTLQYMVLRKLNFYMQKIKVGYVSYAIHKNQMKNR
jgi:hypothetical protein